MAFSDNLAMGQLGESLIARWLRARGTSVLPAYEKEIDSGKGPRLFCPDGSLVTPDLFAFPSLEFIEAKHKSVFTWHHRTGRWLTGIDLHHYADYQEVQSRTNRRVWLLFLHRCCTPDEIDRRGRGDCPACDMSLTGSCCPAECPTGLFGNSLKYLRWNEHHRHHNHGRHGMVYWEHDRLRPLASLEDIETCEAVA